MRIVGVLFVSIMISLSAQNNNVYELMKNPFKHAEFLYKKHHYVKSAFFFEKAYSNDTSNKQSAIRAAQAYKRANRFNESRFWFAKLENERSEELLFKHEVVFDYFDVLKMVNDSVRLDIIRNKVLKGEMNPTVSKLFLELVVPKKNFYSDSATSTVTIMPFNTAYDEICPMLFDNRFVYLSNRPTPSLVKNDVDTTGFFNFYTLPLSKSMDSEPMLWREFSKIRNEGPITIFNNGTRAIVSQNISKTGNRKLALFIYEKSRKGVWNNRGKLSFCDKNLSYSHPFFHEPTRNLYFVVSDGETDNTDIYKSHLKDNLWEEPEPLPSMVNTIKSELFPFVTKDNRLYFSSNGLNGMGGFDLFYIQLDSLGTDAINLGYPINSEKDDLSLVLLPNGKEGYFSSNRLTENRDDIYRVKFHQIKYVLAVRDKLKGSPIKNGSLRVIDFKTDEVVYNKSLNSKNEMILKPGRKYMIEVNAHNFKSESYPLLFTQKNDTTVFKNLFLDKINKSFVRGKVLAVGKPVQSGIVKILDISSDSVEVTQIKNDGSFVCEINRDTVTYFFVSNGKDSSMFRYEPVKKTKRGSGVTFIDIDLVKMKTKSIEFSVLDSSNVQEKDTIWLRNDISRNKLQVYPNAFPMNKIVFWDAGHYSFVIKNAEIGFEQVGTIGVSDKLKKITLIYDRNRKYNVKME